MPSVSSVGGPSLTQRSNGSGQVTPTVPTPSPPLTQGVGGHTVTQSFTGSSPVLLNASAPGLRHIYACVSDY